jgi:hypothetical protein
MLASRWVLGLLAIVMTAGCGGNAFKDSYRSSLERWPNGEVGRLLPATGNVEIVTSNDIERDDLGMMESGYLLLGRSKFEGNEVNPDAAREVARDLGASVVLLKTEYARTVREAIPVERWAPMRREESAHVAGATGSGAGLTIHGEFQTKFVRRPVAYYDYAATFWAKSKAPIFGVLVEAQRAQVESDANRRGVVVRAVIADSPASSAGVRHDDVIVRFAGTEIVDPNQFFDTVVANKGRQVEVEIVRVSESKVQKLQLQLRNE